MSTKKMKSRKTYTSEFKTQAIDLAKELGVKKAAEKLGIPGQLDWNTHWVRYDKKISSDKEFRSSEELKAELKKVKKELEEKNKIIAILKDATVFFCKENVK